MDDDIAMIYQFPTALLLILLYLDIIIASHKCTTLDDSSHHYFPPSQEAKPPLSSFLHSHVTYQMRIRQCQLVHRHNHIPLQLDPLTLGPQTNQ